MNKTETVINNFLKGQHRNYWKMYTEKELAKLLNIKLLEVKKALKTLTKSGDVEKIEDGWAVKTTKLTLQEKIIADVDDVHYALTKKIQKKYKLSWKKARDYTNWSARVLMLSFPEEWLPVGKK